MMKAQDVNFDSNFEMHISIPEQSEKVYLTLSDDLEAVEEELLDEYKSKIASFINNSGEWYDQFKNYISDWAKKEYALEMNKAILVNIHVLFEQAENEVFGLEYGVDFDEEHGCGIKVKIIDGEFRIFEIGSAYVAFV